MEIANRRHQMVLKVSRPKLFDIMLQCLKKCEEYPPRWSVFVKIVDVQLVMQKNLHQSESS